MHRVHLYTFFLFSAVILASCNFGGTKKKHFYGDKATHFKAKTYNDFYKEKGRAPRKDEKKQMDHWADSLKNVGGIMNGTEYSTEYGTKETEKSIIKK